MENLIPNALEAVRLCYGHISTVHDNGQQVTLSFFDASIVPANDMLKKVRVHKSVSTVAALSPEDVSYYRIPLDSSQPLERHFDLLSNSIVLSLTGTWGRNPINMPWSWREGNRAFSELVVARSKELDRAALMFKIFDDDFPYCSFSENTPNTEKILARLKYEAVYLDKCVRAQGDKTYHDFPGGLLRINPVFGCPPKPWTANGWHSR